MSKTEKILEIKRILKEWGVVNSMELELESSPCIRSIGNGKNNISELIERFNLNDVEVVTYQDYIEIDWRNENYEDLSEDIIDEIYFIITNYECLNIKTIKRCEN